MALCAYYVIRRIGAKFFKICADPPNPPSIRSLFSFTPPPYTGGVKFKIVTVP